MLGFVARRLGILIPTFLGVSFLAFLFIRLLPGDPILLLAGERSIPPERYEELLERSASTGRSGSSILIYLGQLVQGDLGISFATKRPVLDRVPHAVSGDARARRSGRCSWRSSSACRPASSPRVRRGSSFDHGIMATALVGYSMPIFWWALLLIIVFSGWLRLDAGVRPDRVSYFFKPVTGFMLIDSLISGRRAPSGRRSRISSCRPIVLATIPLAVIARQTRSAMLEVLGEDYVRTARAKGLTPSPRRRPARAPQRADPGGHHHRPAGRHPARRRDPHRDDLLLAGDRQVDGRFDLPARLSGRSRAGCCSSR